MVTSTAYYTFLLNVILHLNCHLFVYVSQWVRNLLLFRRLCIMLQHRLFCQLYILLACKRLFDRLLSMNTSMVFLLEMVLSPTTK